jgi:UDP-N-acetylmuramate dehydrogenase
VSDAGGPEIQGEALRNEPMARHTSFRIGGPADLLVLPAHEDDVVEAVHWASERGLPVTVLGNGTNVLVADAGIRGVTILIAKALAAIRVEGAEVTAGCGAPLMKVAFQAARAGLSGMEFAEGIPGTLGGAIYMNAGTLLGEVKDCLASVDAVTREGERVTLSPSDLCLTYRTSALKETRHILLSARFVLRKAPPEEVKAAMARMRQRRQATQPHAEPSAGCVFKNPGGGRSSGKMLDGAGAKGMTEGGARVSQEHANFVVNAGAARAEDVVNLMRRMRALILEREGILLRPEVEFVGDWETEPFAMEPEAAR